MAITVAELLAEPHLGLELIAGADGTWRTISWAHTSDLERLWEWVSGTELMMTNGMSIPSAEDGQIELAENLVHAGASALAIGERMHAPELSNGLLAECDRLGFPLITIPYPLPFIAISRTVAEATLLEDSQRLRRTARIYDRIRKGGSSGWKLPDLQADLSDELQANLLVVDRRCLHPWAPSGPGLASSMSDNLKRHISERPASKSGFRGVMLDSGGQVLLLDIPTHAEALLVIQPSGQGDPDTTLLLHAATVLGLNMSQEVLSRQSQRRAGAELLRQVLNDDYRVGDVERRFTEIGIVPDDFILVAISTSGSQRLEEIPEALHRHGYEHLALVKDERLYLVLESGCSNETLLHFTDGSENIGVSAPAGASNISRALQESMWALANSADRAGKLHRYDQGSGWLAAASLTDGKTLVSRILGPLLEFERGRKPELLDTLRTYLDCQRSWEKTAAELFVHRQTVVYRIRKIGKLLSLDINETSAVAQLWVALQIHDALEP